MADKILLEDLRPAEGSTGKSKRVGRGRSSGHGKTSCRDRCLHTEDYLN